MNAPRSLTPAGPRRQASYGAPVLPSAFDTAQAPTAGLSGLNHAARSLPVYASPRRVTSLDATLGTGWWLPLPGRVMLPAGLLRKVSAKCHVIASSSPKLGLAHIKIPIRIRKKKGSQQLALGLGVLGSARLAQAARGQDPQDLGVLHLTQPAHEGGREAPQERELIADQSLAAAEGRRHLGVALGLEVAGVEQIGPPNGIL